MLFSIAGAGRRRARCSRIANADCVQPSTAAARAGSSPSHAPASGARDPLTKLARHQSHVIQEPPGDHERLTYDIIRAPQVDPLPGVREHSAE